MGRITRRDFLKAGAGAVAGGVVGAGGSLVAERAQKRRTVLQGLNPGQSTLMARSRQGEQV